MKRSQSHIFEAQLITVRDLLKWGYRHTNSDGTIESLAHEGYLVLAERLRSDEEKIVV